MELSQQIDILNGALALLRGTPEFEKVQAVRDSLIDPYAGAPGAKGINVSSHHQKLIDLSFGLVGATTWFDGGNTANVPRDRYNALFDYLHQECPKPSPVKIGLVIEGGTLTAVLADREDVTVILRDFDNINAGDADPFEEFKSPETGEVNWVDAGLPCEVQVW